MGKIPSRRMHNIIQRMLDGDEFYTNQSPRISRKEIQELNSLGLLLQVEHTYGAMAGPIAVYPLHQKEFADKAAQIFGLKAKTS